MVVDINDLGKYIDLTRWEVRRLGLSQKLAIANRNFARARSLGVSTTDYLKGIGCKNII